MDPQPPAARPAFTPDPTLTPVQVARGFVREAHQVYVHVDCGRHNRLTDREANIMARNPAAFSKLDCRHCQLQLPVSAFVWYFGGAQVGS